MSADIIYLPTTLSGRREIRPDPAVTDGNGAREALIELARALPVDIGRPLAELWTDAILKELWVRGFMVVPVSDKVIR